MNKFALPILLALASFNAQAKEISLDGLYESFNMRTIFSSYGQRLKYYCESYPKEYFPVKKIEYSEDKKAIHLSAGDDFWTIRIIDSQTIGISNTISSGTYRSFSEYKVKYNSVSKDWRANETFIEKPKDCVKFSVTNS